MSENLNRKPTLTLLFELMCQQHAQGLPKEYSNYFDTDTSEVVMTLNKRYGKNFTDNFDSMYHWFVSEDSPLSKVHIGKLTRMKDFRDGKIGFDVVFSEIMSDLESKKL